MVKRYYIMPICACLVICMVLTGCGKKNTENAETLTPTEGISKEPTPIVTATPPEESKPKNTATPTPSPTQTPTLVPIPERDSDSIRVAISAFGRITEEESKEINRILREKGIPCEVEFIPDTYHYHASEWERWIAENEDRLDIVHVGAWNSDNFHMRGFMKNYLLPLNDYLDTEEGKALKEAYWEKGWKSAEAEDGRIYAVPSLGKKAENRVYIAVNNEYLSHFSGFQGDYNSLKRICEQIDYPEQKIVTAALNNYVITALSGYDWIYGNIPYDAEEKTVVSTSECLEALQGTCLELYQDLNDGVLVHETINPEKAEHPLIYIYSGEREEREGYTSLPLCDKQPIYGTSGTYGVLASCPRKELALQVLTACFSDPKIASILCWKTLDQDFQNTWDWDSTTDRWEERMKQAASEESGRMEGFFPEFSDEETSALNEYSNDLQVLSNGFYVPAGEDDAYKLNPNYERNLKSNTLWSPKKHELYTIGIEALNREVEGWKAKHQ